MARQRRFDGNLGSLEVPDLADEDDVGVLAEEASESGGEVEADLLARLDLVDPRKVELDRVLGRHDVHLGGVDALEGRVEGVGLP